MDKKRFRVVVMCLFLCWTALILYGSLAPDDSLPAVGWLGRIPHFDKMVHFCFYLGEVTLLILWLQPSRSGRWWVALGVIAFSGAVELLQGEYFERSADELDMAANSLGALLGIPFSSLLGKKLGGVISRQGDPPQAKR